MRLYFYGETSVATQFPVQLPEQLYILSIFIPPPPAT